MFPSPIRSAPPLELSGRPRTPFAAARRLIRFTRAGLASCAWLSPAYPSSAAAQEDLLPTAVTVDHFEPAWRGSILPSGFIRAGATVFFSSGDPAYGPVLWKSDGSLTGRIMVKPHLLMKDAVAVGERIIFNDAYNDLWVSDGTETGTLRVRDNGPANPSFPYDNFFLTEMNGAAYFTASSGVWRTDGTAAGTVPLHRRIGSGSRIIAVGSTLYFGWSSGTDTGQELWKSDGTEAGTVMVKDGYPGPGSGFLPFSPLVGAGGLVYFLGNSDASGAELWRSDGTAEGTFELKDVNPGRDSGSPALLTAVGNLLLFAAETPANGRELWKTDGTVAGTALVKDIVPGNFSGISPGSDDAKDRPAAPGGNMFFKAFSSEAGWELWKSDGTAAGTVLVKDLAPRTPDGFVVSSYPAYFRAWRGAVYFWTDVSNEGSQLWRTDGTPGGTFQLTRPGNPGARRYFTPPILGELNDRLLFAGHSASGDEALWATDGTVEGTVPVMTTSVGVPTDFLSSVSGITAAGEDVYFRAKTPEGGLGLWRAGRSPSGASLLKNVAPANSLGFPSPVVSAGKLTYFFLGSAGSAYQLWRTDGTPGGAALVHPRAGLSMAALGNRLLFPAEEEGMGEELWVADDTGSAPALLKDLQPGTAGGAPRHFTVIGDTAYFSASGGGVEGSGLLWKTDGSSAGTIPLRTFTTAGNGADYRLSSLTASGGTLFFTVGTTAGRELWKSNGLPGGTVMVRDIQPGIVSSLDYDAFLAPLGDRVYFQASQEVIGPNLWSSNGAAAGTVSAWRQDGTHRLPVFSTEPLVPCGRLLFYLASTPANGEELWRTDNTLAGTRMVKDIYPGERDSSVRILGQKYGILYFAASDDRHGIELWRTDGTEEGTLMVSDLAPGTGSSIPVSFAATEEGAYYGVENDGAGEPALRYLSWPVFQGAAEITAQPDGGVKLRFTGLRPRAHAVDASTDLRAWTELSTGTPLEDGTMEQAVPPTAAAGRFFRVRDVARQPVP